MCVLLIKGIVLPMMVTNKKNTFLLELVQRWKVRNDQLGAGALGDIKKDFGGLLHNEEVKKQGNTRNTQAFVPKND